MPSDTGGMTSGDSSNYWGATDQVIALARGLVLTGAVDRREVDAILDVPAGLLTRVTTNLACAEYVFIGQKLGFNLADPRVLGALLDPLRTFEVIGAADVDTETVAKFILHSVQDFVEGNATTGEAVIPLYWEGAAPAAMPLNGAMPIIVALLQKCIPLAGDPLTVTLTPEGRETKLDQTIESVRAELSAFLKV